MIHDPLAHRRDDLRFSQSLRSHLEAGQFKAECWALADSLAWALSYISSTTPENGAIDEQAMGEYRLARVRFDRVRDMFKEGDSA